MREAVDAFEKLVAYMPKLSSEVSVAVKSIKQLGMLSDFIGCHVLVRPEDKQKILEAVDPMKRIQLLITIMYEEQDLLSAELDIHKKVQERLNKNQREYFLREQLKVIRSELGDDTASETEEYLEKIKAARLPEDIEKKLKGSFSDVEEPVRFSRERGASQLARHLSRISVD